MASSFWVEDKYRIHFFCALCGGPFARVYRTDESPEHQRAESPESSDDTYEDDHSHTIPKARNERLWGQEQEEDTSSIVMFDDEVAEDFKWETQVPLGSIGTSNTGVWRAYDGRHIDEKDMRWTRVMRALIHRHAQIHPEGGLEQLDNEQDVYLTGRGRVLEHASWAVAYPSIEDELEDDDDPNVALSNGSPFKFHLYQEPDRTDRKFHISSIPFHEECWDIFFQALQSSQAARGLEVKPIGDVVSHERIWSYLCDMIPTAVSGGLSDLTSESLASGTAIDPIKRLSIGCMGRMGYREAQHCGNRQLWRHVEGLHWLVADPRHNKLSHNPFTAPRRAEVSQPAFLYKHRRASDPFQALPAEVLVEIFSYLSCVDLFCWRVASVQVNLVVIPQREYRRFFLEEMAFLPGLLEEMKTYESSHVHALIDWKNVFEDVSRTWRQDISLRNRRRIWKIVEPMAEELIERSSHNLRAVAELSEEVSTAISVVRGDVGIRSGAGGDYQTLVFSDLFRPKFERHGRARSTRRSAPAGTLTWPAWEDHTTTPEEFSHALERITIWLHPERKHICGLRFVFLNERSLDVSHRTLSKILGTRTTLYQSFPVKNANQVLTGFRVCWAQGFLQGIQFVFEDMLKEPTEYFETEYLSPCYGRSDGPVRRLVAPRKFRTLAGVTGFVNSSGLIETFAILEKKRPVMNPGRHYLLTPPDTVPLSHHEASMWKCPPPNDVDVLERLGPCVLDWRIWTAQCEVFAATALYRPPGRISNILLHNGWNSDGWYLTGIRFLFKTDDDQTVHKDLGECNSMAPYDLPLRPSDEVSHAVVTHGKRGIRSLQLVTSSGTVGPVCGTRYVGAHVAYTLKSKISGAPQERSGNLLYLESPIIGFHCLYSHKLRRILQLGIVTRASSSNASSSAVAPANLTFLESSARPSVGLPLPFLDIDELSNPWVDGPPPKYLVRGRKNSDPMKTLKVASSATFAGWVSLHDTIAVEVYGDMHGVEFRNDSEECPNRFFGNDGDDLGVGSQTWQFEETEKPFHYIAHERPKPWHEAGYLPIIRLLKDSPTMDPMLEEEVASKYLAAIKFSFSAERIIDWQPLFDYRAAGEADLHEKKHCWKSPEILKLYPSAEADQDLHRYYPVLADFWVDSKLNTNIDGIKGYWMSTSLVEEVGGAERDGGSTRFCGLRFRRQGLWDEEPLGQASAFERTFLLCPHEEIISVLIVGAGQFGTRGAVAFKTNLGRTTPWIGDPTRGKLIAKNPPPKRKLVGLYLAYSGPRHFDTVGIIHDKAVGSVEEPLLFPLTPPNSSSLANAEATISLNWMLDPNHLPPGYQVSKSVGTGVAAIAARKFRRPANTLIDPENLASVEAYINKVQGRYGIKALRFHGTRRMGTVILGGWHEERARPWDVQQMQFKGVEGERIVGIKFTFHRQDHGNRIIGFLIKTNFGQQRDISPWTSVTEESPPESETYHEEFTCRPNWEVVGFQYLATLYVHDIAVITRPKVESSNA